MFWVVFAPVIPLVATLLVSIVGSIYEDFRLRNIKTPGFFNVCFDVTYPGAGDRYREYFVVDCKDRDKNFAAQSIGANWGELSYDDLDGDGVAEVILTSERGIFDGSCADETKTVYKLHVGPPAVISEISVRKRTGPRYDV
jgi:hypothetical protein